MIQHPIMNHKRAVMMGRLIPCEGEKSTAKGTMILFNAKTNADAERYIGLDPLMKATSVYDKKSIVISPVNAQDVDGLHHMMARTFGEKTVLDQVCTQGDCDDVPCVHFPLKRGTQLPLLDVLLPRHSVQTY
jgi:hypothetical protein